MNKRTQFIARKRRNTIFFLVAGLVLFLLGLAIQFQIDNPPFNPRILSGLGIFLAGLGIASLTGYLSVRGDSPDAARILNEEMDERIHLLKTQAGNRAYWVSLALAFTGLMWSSFAENGSLPPMLGDPLWWYLTLLVVLPFLVYMASLMAALKN